MVEDLRKIIVFEDENFLVLNKPSGLLVHPVNLREKEKEITLVDLLKKYYPFISEVGDNKILRPGIVHRLDKETSGVLLVAKNQDYFNYFKELFQKKEIKKTYLALVFGRLKEKRGIINQPISLKKNSIKRTIFAGKLKKEAITEFKAIHYFKNYTFLEIYPQTGRTHQIRVHLKSINHPIVGDKLYTSKKPEFEINRIFLHAFSLEFSLKNNQRVRFEVDLPPELNLILNFLKNNRSID